MFSDQDHLQEEAALYASGAMTRPEREEFELLLEANPELQKLTDDLHEAVAATLLEEPVSHRRGPSPALKDRILAQIEERGQRTEPDAIVLSDADALVEWVNPVFTEMCGYGLEELRGRKLGPLLQGPLTCPEAARRMREAVHAPRSCHTELINYRKDGSTYLASIDMKPIFKPDGSLRCYVARVFEKAA
jgi:PAS domain S-box-containing protein